MQLKNTNPLGAVDLPLIGRTLQPGEVFDVPDVHGKALLEQVGNYEAAKPPRARKATPKKAAAPKAADKAAAQAEKASTS